MSSAQPKSLETGPPSVASSSGSAVQPTAINLVRQFPTNMLPPTAVQPVFMPTVPRGTASVIPMGSFMENKNVASSSQTAAGQAAAAINLQNLQHQIQNQALVRQLGNVGVGAFSPANIAAMHGIQAATLKAAGGSGIPTATQVRPAAPRPQIHLKPQQMAPQPGLNPRPQLTQHRLPLVTQGLNTRGLGAQQPMKLQHSKVHVSTTATITPGLGQKTGPALPRPPTLGSGAALGVKQLPHGQHKLEHGLPEHARSAVSSGGSTIQISVQSNRTAQQFLQQTKAKPVTCITSNGERVPLFCLQTDFTALAVQPLATPVSQQLLGQSQHKAFVYTGPTPLTLAGHKPGSAALPMQPTVIRQPTKAQVLKAPQLPPPTQISAAELARMTSKTVVQSLGQNYARPVFTPKVSGSLPARSSLPQNTGYSAPIAKVRPSQVAVHTPVQAVHNAPVQVHSAPMQGSIHSAPMQVHNTPIQVHHAPIQTSLQPRGLPDPNMQPRGLPDPNSSHQRLLQMFYQQQQLQTRPQGQARVLEANIPAVSELLPSSVAVLAAAAASTAPAPLTAPQIPPGAPQIPAGAQSPLRPSILRKRTHEGLTMARRNIIGYPSSNETSRTESCSSQVPGSPPKHMDQENSQSSTDTASSTHSTPLKHRPEENGHELSPRKKPRKQLLPPAQAEEQRASDEFESEDEGGKVDGQPADSIISTFVKLVEKTQKEKEEEKEPEIPEELTDADGTRWVRERKTTSVQHLLQSYYVGWKPRNNHYLKYTDVRVKEDRKATVNELSNQKQIQQKISGWKLYQVAAQMDQLAATEDDLIAGIVEAQEIVATLKPTPMMSKQAMEDNISMYQELGQGNILRCRESTEQIKEARAAMLKLMEHKPRVEQVISKHHSKRQVKKKERT